MVSTANELCLLIHDTLAENHQLNKEIKGALHPSWLHALADIKEQLAGLIFNGFINHVPIQWLREYPRYFKAINKRLEKLNSAPQRDRQHVLEIQPLWRAYQERKAKHEKQGIVDDQLEQYRWMIEELRVSLFAQELGTLFPISAKRVKKQMEQVK